MRDVTAVILDRMTTILIEAQTAAHEVEVAAQLDCRDREALLHALSRISAQADAVLAP